TPDQRQDSEVREQDSEVRDKERHRDAFFDNAKFLAIVLVVVGHSIGKLRDQPLVHAAYLFIYLFHMPVFIVVAGYLSRGFTLSGGRARKLVTSLAVPYVIFEVAYTTYHWPLRVPDELSLLDPSYLVWFLLSLFVWRLTTPIWQQFRWPLAVAVLISLASG